jgi:quinol-cytochrome oxidoreductase complex cytochrome b subunit
MLKSFARKNVTMVSVMLFMLIFVLVQLYKPAFLYNNDGSIREFGVGYKNKTIMPIWLFSLILGIFSYLGVLYYNIL